MITVTTVTQKAKELPSDPGVYLMKDLHNRIIYVGKAKNLKKRVSSYFSRSEQEAKTKALVAKICDFDVMVTGSEVEALLLERTLIKHHAPVYNILLRDDKEFPFVRIDYQAPWPRLQKVRRRKDDGAKYIGPFGNAGNLNTTLQMLRDIFPLVRCSTYEFAQARRPCNYYHMKLCLAPCTLPVDRSEYVDILQTCEAILNGKTRDVKNHLEQKMRTASEAEQFEKAATMRDQLKALTTIGERQVAVTLDIEEADVIGVFRTNDHLVFHVLFVRDFTIIGGDNFIVGNPMDADDDAIESFLMQYYEYRYLPALLILPHVLSNAKSLLDALQANSLKKSTILSGQAGERKQLMQMAVRNASFNLNETKSLRPLAQIELNEMKQVLGLERLPERIECVDISNLQGSAIVASVVCFLSGKPAKHLYRKYKIKTITEAADDFGSIREVVKRRLQRAYEDDDVPDLLVIDGGKGQLAAALESLVEFPTLKLDLISLAKSRSEYGPGDQWSASFERIFKPGDDLPINLREGTSTYRILTRIRDEAHRFAIRYHRQRRQKESHQSALDGIVGLGPALKKRLLLAFHDVESIRNSSIEELTKVPGIHQALAERIHTELKSKRSE